MAIRNEELRQAFERAARAVVEAAARLNVTPYLLEEEEWQRDGGSFVRRRVKRVRWLLQARVEALRELPEFQAVVDELRNDSVIAPQLDTLVGSELGGASRVETDTVVCAVITRMMGNKLTAQFDQSALDAAYAEMEEFFYATEFIRRLVVPLPGFALEHDLPMAVEDDVTVEVLSDDDIALCIELGFIEGFGMSPVVHVGQQVVALVARTPLPKTSGDDMFNNAAARAEDAEVVAALSARDVEIANRLQTALRLTTPKVFAVPGYLVGMQSWQGRSFQYQALPHSQKVMFNNLSLSAEDSDLFANQWQLLVQSANSKRLSVALRRFAHASTRPNVDDRLIDVIIAAEALFLTDGKQELSYRLGLRAAFFIDHPEYSRREIFDQMKRAYNARSAVVHGHHLARLKMPDGSQGSELQFVELTEDLMRVALRRALRLVVGAEDGELDEWDNRILPS